MLVKRSNAGSLVVTNLCIAIFAALSFAMLKCEQAFMVTSVLCRVYTNVLCRVNGFDDQERNLAFVKMNFQILRVKFYALQF